MLPDSYDRVEVEREIQALTQRIVDRKTVLTFNPVSSPVVDPVVGMIQYFDGTTDDFGAIFNGYPGLYRYDLINTDDAPVGGWIRITDVIPDFFPYTFDFNLM